MIEENIENNKYEYVINTDRLKNICKEIKNNTEVIALDTEFIRKTTYFPILCLVQISYFDKNGNIKNFVIDALQDNLDLTYFYKSILNNCKIKKIIHSFSQDLEALNFRHDIKINNLEDTQIMAEFCGFGSNLGYSKLVEKVLGINYKKNENIQHSNWKKRPLTDSQKIYAANDVIFLISIYNGLLKELKEIGNYEYYNNEIEHILKYKNKNFVINNSWRKMKFNLNNRSLNYSFLLKELCKWREEKAIANNVIRNFIIEDNVLEEIAKLRPKTQKSFNEIFTYSNYNVNISKEYKQEIVNIVSEFNKNLDPQYDELLYYTNEKHFIHKNILDKIYLKIKMIADSRKISINTTINKTDIIALIMKYENKKNILYGWKNELFGNIFEENNIN